MTTKLTAAAFGLFTVVAVIALAFIMRGTSLGIFDPKGLVATEERALIFHALLLMLIVVVPVFILAFAIAWHYREGNNRAVYTPDWEHSVLEELIWWAVPLEIILVLGALTWTSTHQLDPRVPLPGGAPLVIQVVALDWKWLFIYPEQGIAAVNQVEFPAGVPVEFNITADAPMNSFWIPQLGGQIYAMTGMVNKLNLVAGEPGVFQGGSANYSGEGFAQMKFTATAATRSDFDAWVAAAKQSPQTLTAQEYYRLSAPGAAAPALYAFGAKNFYNSLVDKFMGPMQGHDH